MPGMTAAMRAGVVWLASAMVFVGSQATPSVALQGDDGHVVLRVVELGSRPKRPIGSATIRILDGDGKVLASGITATDGTYEAAVRMADPLIVEWSKTGYVRHPEQKKVSGAGRSVELEVDLIRRSADDAYYRAVAQDIKSKAEARRAPAEATATYKEEFARVGELPAGSQRALTSELRKMGVRDLHHLETPAKKEREAAERRATQDKLQIKEHPQTQERFKMQERRR